MFDYQDTHRYFAQIAGGMEEFGAWELETFGAREIRASFRGLYFTAEQAELYRINYCSRFIMRILAPLITFRCHSDRYLYNKAREVPWPALFDPDQTFAVSANVVHSKILHSRYAALRLKDAIVDRFRDEGLERPNVDRIEPNIRFNLYLEHNRAVIGLDTSGESLHRRGYRQRTIEAPMQETLAAVIIHLSGWDGSRPLYDPMCGSGTLLAEALMRYCRIPSGYLKDSFGFQFLPDFDRNLWHQVRQEADGLIRPLPESLIAGSDVDSEAVHAARTNLALLPSGRALDLHVKDFQEIEGLEERVILCNPPYGIRLKTPGDIGVLYKAFGDFLKKRCKGSTAYVYFGNRDMIPRIGLKPAWKKPLSNAGLNGRLARFDLY